MATREISTKGAGATLHRLKLRARRVQKLLEISRTHLDDAECLSEAELRIALADVDRAIKNCDALLRALRTAGARAPVASRARRARQRVAPRSK